MPQRGRSEKTKKHRFCQLGFVFRGSPADPEVFTLSARLLQCVGEAEEAQSSQSNWLTFSFSIRTVDQHHASAAEMCSRAR